MIRKFLLVLTILVIGQLGLVTGLDPDGRVRGILFGDVVDQYGGFNSYVIIQTDPAIRATLVPTRPGYLGGRERAIRNLRIYMPRNYQTLLRGYDLILFSDADRTVFTTEWIEWMRMGVEERVGLLWLGSIGRKPSQIDLDWSITTLADVLPARTSTEYYVYGVFRVVVEDGGEVLMGALPWESSPPLANLDLQLPREGSRVWAVTDNPSRWPLMTYWEAGGSVLCFASKFPNGVMPWAENWALFPQAMIYMVYRTAGRELPGDHLMFRRLTSYFSEYQTHGAILTSLLSFIDQFGGSVKRLYDEMDQISELKSEASALFLGEEYEESLVVMERARERQSELVETGLAEKDRALLWIYVLEWCVVTSTLLLSGAVLWTLMVRRRLYSQVGQTKFSER